jgi:hypothetical protein
MEILDRIDQLHRNWYRKYGKIAKYLSSDALLQKLRREGFIGKKSIPVLRPSRSSVGVSPIAVVFCYEPQNPREDPGEKSFRFRARMLDLLKTLHKDRASIPKYLILGDDFYLGTIPLKVNEHARHVNHLKRGGMPAVKIHATTAQSMSPTSLPDLTPTMVNPLGFRLDNLGELPRIATQYECPLQKAVAIVLLEKDEEGPYEQEA